MNDTAASERSIPQEVLELIERFEHNRDAYRSNEHNEAQVRAEQRRGPHRRGGNS